MGSFECFVLFLIGIHCNISIAENNCPPLSQNLGRCGPSWGGRCNKHLVDYAVYCNEENGWCGVTSAHRYAQASDLYDWEPESCIKNDFTTIATTESAKGNIAVSYEGMACSVTTCRDGQGDCKSNRECPGDLMCSDAGIIPKGYTFKDKEDWSSWFRFCYSTNRDNQPTFIASTTTSTTKTSDDCVDEDDGVYDGYGDGCKWYTGYKIDSCGDYDDDDFKAKSICCSCKGKTNDEKIPDRWDGDDDNDGIQDEDDPDEDNDGIPDYLDDDDDNDGIPDDAEPLDSLDSDNDGIPDIYDIDDDNDGVPDAEDRDDDNDGVPDSVQTTTEPQDIENHPSCIDQKNWCRFADCSLENVKRNCQKTCNNCL